MIEEKLRHYTKLSPDKRAKIFRWVARQNVEIIYTIFQKQKDYYFQLTGSKEPDKFLLYQSAFYLAMHEIYMIIKNKNSKRKSGSLADVVDPTSLQAQRIKKQSNAHKYDRLLDLRSKVLNLKKIDGLSFREMSTYFKTYHRLEVSHTLIRQVYLDLIAE